MGQFDGMYEDQPDYRPQGRRFQEAALPALSCDYCGGQFFMDVNLNKYAEGAHSSTAGGDMEVIGTMVHQIRICPCGRPVAPSISGGRLGRGASETGDVLRTIEHARAMQIEHLEHLDTVIKSAVTHLEMNGVVTELAEVKATNADLSARLKSIEDMIERNRKKEAAKNE